METYWSMNSHLEAKETTQILRKLSEWIIRSTSLILSLFRRPSFGKDCTTSFYSWPNATSSEFTMSMISRMTCRKSIRDTRTTKRNHHTWGTSPENWSNQSKELCTWELSNSFRSAIYSWRLALDSLTLHLDRLLGLTHTEPDVLQEQSHEVKKRLRSPMRNE